MIRPFILNPLRCLARPPQSTYILPRLYTTTSSPKKDSMPYSVTFLLPEEENAQVNVQAKEGESLLELAHRNRIELEGACEGSLACSTCHVIVNDAFYNKMPEPTDEENDMLDLAFGLTDTSRLGCQIKMCKELDGLIVTIPAVTRNMSVDGYKPKPH